MAINYENVKTALYDWASLILPLAVPIIFYHPNSPRPDFPYITLHILSSISVHQDWSDNSTNNAGNLSMKGDRQFTLQIQAYGGDVITRLESLRTSLQMQTVLETLREDGIVFYQSFQINDITELVDSKFEKRAQMDILFGIAQTYNDNVGFFEEVELQEKLYNSLGQVVYDETILIG